MDDRRFQKTEDTIKDAFFILLKKKTINKITIKELCEQANINRSTFYYHYEDYPHLLNSLQNELANKLIECFSLYQFDLNSDNTISELLETVKNNKHLFSIFFEPSPNNKVREVCKKTMKQRSIKKWMSNSGISQEQCEIIFEYIIEGQFALLKYWHDSEFTINQEKLKDIYEHIIHHGLLYYAYKE